MSGNGDRAISVRGFDQWQRRFIRGINEWQRDLQRVLEATVSNLQKVAETADQLAKRVPSEQEQADQRQRLDDALRRISEIESDLQARDDAEREFMERD